jgi:steroid 5-alpha reductase family enzyme
MIGRLLLVNAILLFIYMTLWFTAAKIRNRLDTVDTAWGLGFVVAAWAVAVQEQTSRSFVIALLVSVWGIRLANHIWQRSKIKGEDPRYEEIASKWKGNKWLTAFYSIFMTQGLLIWIVSLPIVMAAGTLRDGMSWLTIFGGVIWLKGFVIEAVADKQLGNFLRTKNHPKLLQTGLWKYSRHPNYFGELVQWWGIGVIALQAAYGYIGLIGPLVISILIIFVSGIPPIERRKANDKEYQDYKRRTSSLVPLPPRK